MSRDGRDGRDGKDGDPGRDGEPGDPGRPGRDADPEQVARLLAKALRELPATPAPSVTVQPATAPRASWRFVIHNDADGNPIEMIATPI